VVYEGFELQVCDYCLFEFYVDCELGFLVVDMILQWNEGGE